MARPVSLLGALILLVASSGVLSQETVTFPALSPFEGRAVQLTAVLYRPSGSGHFPAIVMMHGCGGMYNSKGVTPSYQRWAETMRDQGYVALLVDSFRPRGAGSICAQQQRTILESRERQQDAYAALAWLSSQPYVRADRIGLMGWSNGASGTLQAMRRELTQRFAAAVAFYPGCGSLSRSAAAYKPHAPLLILIGESDDWTLAEPCARLTQRARESGSAVDIVIYPGAYHSFDRINLPVRYRENVRNLNKPDGCCGATVGEHPAAREDAYARVQAFFAAHLQE